MSSLTLIVPRASEIGYTQPCIKCRGISATHFVYFWSRKTLPYTHLEATSYIPQQGLSFHIWTTSLSTTGCYKNKYTIQFLWMACISRFAAAISSGETELALGTIRVKYRHTQVKISVLCSCILLQIVNQHKTFRLSLSSLNVLRCAVRNCTWYLKSWESHPFHLLYTHRTNKTVKFLNIHTAEGFGI